MDRRFRVHSASHARTKRALRAKWQIADMALAVAIPVLAAAVIVSVVYQMSPEDRDAVFDAVYATPAVYRGF